MSTPNRTKSHPISVKIVRKNELHGDRSSGQGARKKNVMNDLVQLLDRNINCFNDAMSSSDSEKADSSQCIIYLRCSSKKQNDIENGQHGFDTQEQDCIDYAYRNGFEIIQTIKQTRRATSMVGLEITDIPKKYQNINIILADPSRLSRNYGEGVKFINDCEQKGIILHFARDDISSDNTDGKKKIMSLLVDANEESKVFSKRVRSAVRQKMRYGSKMGCAKYGFELYRSETEGFPIMKERPNADEQKIIKLISMYYFGTTMEPFHNLIRDITGKNDFIMTYKEKNVVKQYENIQYGYFNYEDVGNMLNEHKITKRGKQWSGNSVKSVIDYLIDFLNQSNQPVVYYNEKGITKQNFNQNTVELYYHNGECRKKIKYNENNQVRVLYDSKNSSNRK